MYRKLSLILLNFLIKF